MTGTLYVCATPIGNMEDITLRVLRVLREADFIAAEDTRRTVKILNHYDIKTPLVSYHEHNKRTRGGTIVNRLLAGENAALVSDAGMPGISDPGYDLIKLCKEASVPVTVCPGASAAVTAAVLSGLCPRGYVFEGFLPVNGKERRAVFDEIENGTRAFVLYESPHKLVDTLAALEKYTVRRKIAVLRELTKKFEEVVGGTAAEVSEHFKQTEPKGEFVIVIEGISGNDLSARKAAQYAGMTVAEHVKLRTGDGMTEKDAIKAVADERNILKRDVYKTVKG